MLREIDEGLARVAVKTPCLATFTKPARQPRYPTIKRKMAAAKAEIRVISEDDLPELDRAKIGLKGSPTHVKKTFVPQVKKGGVMINESDGAACVEKLFALLKEAKLF